MGGCWGTVCGNYFDNNAARVACKQLGFLSDGKEATLSNKLIHYQSISFYIGAYAQYYRFGSGSGPIWLNGYQCTGNETSIFDCPITYNSYDGLFYCNHNNDAELFCPGK